MNNPLKKLSLWLVHRMYPGCSIAIVPFDPTADAGSVVFSVAESVTSVKVECRGAGGAGGAGGKARVIGNGHARGGNGGNSGTGCGSRGASAGPSLVSDVERFIHLAVLEAGPSSGDEWFIKVADWMRSEAINNEID